MSQLIKCDYDIKNSTVMQKAEGIYAHLNWACGQNKLLSDFTQCSHIFRGPA